MYDIHQSSIVSNYAVKELRRDLKRAKRKSEILHNFDLFVKNNLSAFDMPPMEWDRISFSVTKDIEISLDNIVVFKVECISDIAAKRFAARVRVLRIDKHMSEEGLLIDWNSGMGYCSKERKPTVLSYGFIATPT